MNEGITEIIIQNERLAVYCFTISAIPTLELENNLTDKTKNQPLAG